MNIDAFRQDAARDKDDTWVGRVMDTEAFRIVTSVGIGVIGGAAVVRLVSRGI